MKWNIVFRIICRAGESMSPSTRRGTSPSARTSTCMLKRNWPTSLWEQPDRCDTCTDPGLYIGGYSYPGWIWHRTCSANARVTTHSIVLQDSRYFMARIQILQKYYFHRAFQITAAIPWLRQPISPSYQDVTGNWARASSGLFYRSVWEDKLQPRKYGTSCPPLRTTRYCVKLPQRIAQTSFIYVHRPRLPRPLAQRQLRGHPRQAMDWLSVMLCARQRGWRTSVARKRSGEVDIVLNNTCHKNVSSSLR